MRPCLFMNLMNELIDEFTAADEKLLVRGALRAGGDRYSVYLLYWYNSTNADAAAQQIS